MVYRHATHVRARRALAPGWTDGPLGSPSVGGRSNRVQLIANHSSSAAAAAAAAAAN